MAAYLNVWNPTIARPSEHSLSQIAVGAWDQVDEDTLQTVEAGWIDYGDLYNDSVPHLFVYFTADNYGNTGCYDMTCDGFVQVHRTIAPGGAFSTVSVSGGSQSVREFRWQRISGDWWLIYNGQFVGYFPAHLFDSAGLGRAGGGTSVGFFGEVTDKVVGSHTTTDMGSGAFPSTTIRKSFRSWA